MKNVLWLLGLVVLAGAEFICFWQLRKHGFSMPVAAGITLGFCVTLFLLIGFMFLSRAAPYARVSNEESDLNTVLRQRHAATLVARRPANPAAAGTSSGSAPAVATGEGGGFSMPSGTTPAASASALTNFQSEAFRDELIRSLEEKRGQFQKVLADSSVELSRFDYSVLKTLSRNNPGSVEGVLIARRIHHALEHRYKEIDRFLVSQPAVDPEKGKQLLLGDLEVPEENQLTAVFKSPAVPPIKISEVEFQLRVLLKRISRRRSIFRSTDMMDAQTAAEEIAKERAAQEAASSPANDNPEGALPSIVAPGFSSGAHPKKESEEEADENDEQLLS